MNYIVPAVELDDIVPRRRMDYPNVYVGVRAVPKTSELLAFIQRRSRRYGSRALRLLQELETLPRFEDKKAARLHRDQLAQTLASVGFTVNPTVESSRHVYVLELDKIKLGKKYRNVDSEVLYVGETGLTIEERIRNHLRGYQDSPAVRAAFVKRRPDLEPQLRLYSVWDSKAEEADWAEKLSGEGYEVISH